MQTPQKNELMITLTLLSHQIQKRLTGPLSVHGLSLTEYLVLRMLSLAPSHKLRRTDLADGVGLSASGVTRLLKPMEKTGLIKSEDNPRDARVSLITLTKTGKRVLLDAQTSFDHVASSFTAPLEADQAHAFLQAAKALYRG